MGGDSTMARVLDRLLGPGATGAAGTDCAETVSGQQIADDLGLSRNAVWKAVTALREAGYVIDAGPRSGYRLVSVPEPIDPEEVLSALHTRLFHSIEYIPETGSTNDVAKQRAKAGAPEGTVVVADRQLQGRGRRGRSWETAPGQSLLLSIILRPDIPPRKAPLLVFLAAAAVRRALLPYGETFIKWPNDVVTAGGRKLCGILVEMDAEHDRVRHCVVGIGLNVRQRPQDFAEHVRDSAASVANLTDESVTRMAVLPRLLDEFARRYETALQDGFASVLREMREHSATFGRAVLVHEADGTTWEGTALDVQEDGALLVRPAAGDDDAEGRPVAVYAAEVSIRMEETNNETK